MSVQQIVKILTLYTPHSDLDERVTLNFIRTVQVRKSRSTAVRSVLLIDFKITCVSVLTLLGAPERPF